MNESKIEFSRNTLENLCPLPAVPFLLMGYLTWGTFCLHPQSWGLLGQLDKDLGVRRGAAGGSGPSVVTISHCIWGRGKGNGSGASCTCYFILYNNTSKQLLLLFPSPKWVNGGPKKMKQPAQGLHIGELRGQGCGCGRQCPRCPPPVSPASWSSHLSVTPPREWGLDLVTPWEGEGRAAAVGRRFQDYVVRNLWLLLHALPLRAWLWGKHLLCGEQPHGEATWHAGAQGLSAATWASWGAEHPTPASPPFT